MNIWLGAWVASRVGYDGLFVLVGLVFVIVAVVFVLREPR